MGRKITRLTLDHLEALRLPCRTCLFWELDPVRRTRVEDSEAEVTEKETWLSQVLREWGSCGRVALVDERPVGYALYAPAAFLPGAAAFSTAPVSPDAVLLAALRVSAEYAGGGLGRMLVQGMAGDLIRRGGIHAVEAFGDARGGRSCLVPAEFLGSVGFKTHRPHPATPRMRMELGSTLTWRDEVEAALERLLGAVRPAPAAHKPALQAERAGDPPAAR